LVGNINPLDYKTNFNPKNGPNQSKQQEIAKGKNGNLINKNITNMSNSRVK